MSGDLTSTPFSSYCRDIICDGFTAKLKPIVCQIFIKSIQCLAIKEAELIPSSFLSWCINSLCSFATHSVSRWDKVSIFRCQCIFFRLELSRFILNGWQLRAPISHTISSLVCYCFRDCSVMHSQFRLVESLIFFCVPLLICSFCIDGVFCGQRVSHAAHSYTFSLFHFDCLFFLMTNSN